MSRTRESFVALRSYPYIAAGVAVIVGALGVIGEVSRVAAPRTEASLSALSALLAALCGLAALATVPARPARLFATAGRFCGFLAAGVAGLLLADDLLPLEIDLGRRLHELFAGWPPDEPSTHGALAYAALGIALVMVGDRSLSAGKRRIVDGLAVLAVGVGSIALLGHVFGMPQLYGMQYRDGHTFMTAASAALVVAQGLGVLATRIEHSMIAVVVADDAGGVAARRLFVGLLAFPPVCIAVLAAARMHSTAAIGLLILVGFLGPGSALIIATANRLSRADAALRASRAHVSVLIDQASDPIFIADLEGRYTDVNEAACRLLGYARAELLGKPITELIPQEHVERLARSRERMMDGSTDVSEWTLRHRDGTWLPVEVSAKIFPDGRWQGIVRDIRERKRVEADLARAASAERSMRMELETVIDAASSAVADEPGGLESLLAPIAEAARTAVDAAYGAIGIGSDPHSPFDPWVPAGMPDDVRVRIGRAPRPVGVLGEVIRTGEAVRLGEVSRAPQFRGLPPGHPPLSTLLAVPIRRGERVVGTLFLANKQGGGEFSADDEAIVQALAQRVAPAIEIATRYAEQVTARSWLQSILDQLPEGVMVIDIDGKLRVTNGALAAFAHTAVGPDHQDIARSFDVRTPDGHAVPFEDLPLSRAVRDGKVTRERELVMKHPDGRLVPVVASAGPLRDALQRITGAVLVVSEITERKEHERMREEWIAVVAHDLRQPLNSIMLWSDRLARSPNPAAVERIKSAAWRLNRMVQDLLDAARIEATRLSVEPCALDVVEAVTSAIESARLAHPEAIYELSATESALAWFDNDRIQQILANLLSNAAKYGAPEAPIRVAVIGRDADVEVAVTSHGTPISEDESARLFTRFSRTKDARASGVPGIGLGLYITRGLVEAHGGKIWLETTATTNTFRFTLPRPPEH